MTTTTRTPATQRSQRAPMDPLRRTAYVVGVLFVITYITSIAAKFAFYPPFLDNADYIVGDGEDTRVLWGAFAEMILIIANIGTAVALYPVLKRRFPALSLGFVTARVMESVFIAVGILCVVTLVTMRQDFSDAAGGETGARDHQPRPRRPPGVDVQPRARLRRRRRERAPARLHDVPDRPGAPRHGDARTHRWPPHRPVRHGRHPRGHRGRLDRADARRHAGVLLGAQLRRLPDREGFQALGHHHRNGGRTMITVEEVTRTYGNFTAVNHVSFTAQPGRV